MEAGVREPHVNGDSEQLKQVFFNIIGKSFGPRTMIAIATTINISNQPIVGI
mgnify:CR=1 FL=1